MERPSRLLTSGDLPAETAAVTAIPTAHPQEEEPQTQQARLAAGS